MKFLKVKFYQFCLIGAVCGQVAVAADNSEASSSKLKADFRYRHEYISPGSSGATSRNRDRIRFRASDELGIEDNLTLNFGLATGENTDPVSTNTTLGTGFSKFGIFLDKAYFDWAFYESALHFYGGKMKNPLYRPASSELIWDSDLNLDGLDLSFDKTLGQFAVNLQIPFFWVKEEGSNTKDRYLLGLQTKIKSKLSEEM